jgi:conjugal transfer/entry exclusion protein
MKALEQKTEWDKKKIIMFFVAAGFLVGAGLVIRNMMFQGQNAANPSSVITSVKGANTQVANPLSDIKNGIQNQVDNLKNEAQNINVVDIATSSPQVQKVINDLKAIQDYPKNQLRQTCEKICSGL